MHLQAGIIDGCLTGCVSDSRLEKWTLKRFFLPLNSFVSIDPRLSHHSLLINNPQSSCFPPPAPPDPRCRRLSQGFASRSGHHCGSPFYKSKIFFVFFPQSVIKSAEEQGKGVPGVSPRAMHAGYLGMGGYLGRSRGGSRAAGLSQARGRSRPLGPVSA